MTISTAPIAIEKRKQWAFKWSTPGPISFMVPGYRFHFKPRKSPFRGTQIHLTLGRWKSFIRGKSFTIIRHAR